MANEGKPRIYRRARLARVFFACSRLRTRRRWLGCWWRQLFQQNGCFGVTRFEPQTNRQRGTGSARVAGLQRLCAPEMLGGKLPSRGIVERLARHAAFQHADRMIDLALSG